MLLQLFSDIFPVFQNSFIIKAKDGKAHFNQYLRSYFIIFYLLWKLMILPVKFYDQFISMAIEICNEKRLFSFMFIMLDDVLSIKLQSIKASIPDFAPEETFSRSRFFPHLPCESFDDFVAHDFITPPGPLLGRGGRSLGRTV
jgi:hypothetical protein